MNTDIEKLCPDPIVVKCPICWNQSPFSPGWMRAVPLVECPKCAVVIRDKAAQPEARTVQATGFKSLSHNPTHPVARHDASRHKFLRPHTTRTRNLRARA